MLNPARRLWNVQSTDPKELSIKREKMIDISRFLKSIEFKNDRYFAIFWKPLNLKISIFQVTKSELKVQSSWRLTHVKGSEVMNFYYVQIWLRLIQDERIKV